MQLTKQLRSGRIRHRAWPIAVVAILVCGSAGDVAWAAKKPPAAKEAAEEAPQRDTLAAQKAYAAGTRAFESGDMAEAERQLSVAISAGGLPNAQMARALYYRGSASRQLGRPAQAISDLTTAVWLKGGLEGDDRKKAIEARQLAYQEAGLGDKPPPVGGAPLDQSPSTPAATATPPKPGTIVAVVPPKGSSFWGSITSPSLPKLPSLPSIASLTGSSPTPAATTPSGSAAATPASGSSAPSGTVEAVDPAQSFAQTPAVVTPEAAAPASAAPAPPSAPPQHTAAASWETQTASADAVAPHSATLVSTGYAPIAEGPASPPPQMGMTEQPASAPPQGGTWNPFAGTGQALANTGQSVSGFFSNMWSSVSGASGQPAAEPVAAVTTGSTPSAWGQETTVRTAQTSSMIQRGPETPAEDNLPWTATPSAAGTPVPSSAPQKLASTGVAGGKYKLQVAAVRSREEAERLTQSLQGYPAVRDGIVTAQIDEAVIGSMGTFYRVRLGPYANASEPNQLCKTLRPQGFDCLVVTQ